MTTPRNFDLILLGATGFTGGLVAKYLTTHAPSTARIALAGRSQAKLDLVMASLDRPIATMVVDVTNPASVKAMAEATKVVITTVGPYVLHGEPVVAACAAAGTDYVDLTGEPEFVDTMYVRYDQLASSTGARIIHACGFDSIPHDLGAQFTVEQLPEGVPITLRGFVTMDGTFSGGTAASALEAMHRTGAAKKAHTKRTSMEPKLSGRTAAVVQGRPGKSDDLHQWVIPMPTVDPQIVVTSAQHLERYGPAFTYSHFLVTKTFAGTLATLGGLGALAGLAQVGPARRWLGRRVPPGTGPSAEKRAKSSFSVRFVGEAGAKRVETEVRGGDPGYDATAIMLSQAALCLAFDELPTTSGQQTTASAMGSVLRHRLQGAGIDFAVVTPNEGKSRGAE